MTAVDVAARAKTGQTDEVSSGSKKDTYTTTTIYLPRDLRDLVRDVAFKRAREKGAGKPSMAEIVVEALQRYRPLLDKELVG